MTAFDKLDLAITFLQKHRYYLDPFHKVTHILYLPNAYINSNNSGTVLQELEHSRRCPAACYRLAKGRPAFVSGRVHDCLERQFARAKCSQVGAKLLS